MLVRLILIFFIFYMSIKNCVSNSIYASKINKAIELSENFVNMNLDSLNYLNSLYSYLNKKYDCNIYTTDVYKQEYMLKYLDFSNILNFDTTEYINIIDSLLIYDKISAKIIISLNCNSFLNDNIYKLITDSINYDDYYDITHTYFSIMHIYNTYNGTLFRDKKLEKALIKKMENIINSENNSIDIKLEAITFLGLFNNIKYINTNLDFILNSQQLDGSWKFEESKDAILHTTLFGLWSLCILKTNN